MEGGSLARKQLFVLGILSSSNPGRSFSSPPFNPSWVGKLVLSKRRRCLWGDLGMGETVQIQIQKNSVQSSVGEVHPEFFSTQDLFRFMGIRRSHP